MSGPRDKKKAESSSVLINKKIKPSVTVDESVVNSELLAHQIALNLKNYYALPDKYKSQEEFIKIKNFLHRKFDEIIQNLSSKFKLNKENFLEEANKVLHEVDQHLELGLIDSKNGEMFRRLLRAEQDKLVWSENQVTAYFPSILSKPPEKTPDELKSELEDLQEKNCGFDTNPQAPIPENIGYVKINIFNDPFVGSHKGDSSALVASKAHEIMLSMQNKDAIIFDVRDCPGGSPEMMRLLISYFFEANTPINKYHRPIDNNTEEFKTVPQDVILKMSVYILINSETFSAAESFSYLTPSR